MSDRALGPGQRWDLLTGAPIFHLVEQSPARIDHEGKHEDAAPGDLVMFPRGSAHSIVARQDGAVRLISGFFQYEERAIGSILDSLPALVRIRKGQGENAEWLEPLVFFLLAESRAPGPGARIMISRLIDVLVVRTLRSWAAGQEGGAQGWMGGLSDRRIERALSALHADPLRPWTVAELAQVAAMSRSAFAGRFTACTGEPPLRYLKNWRLALARDLLASGSRRVGDVARQVGYEAEAAFSRAYRSRFGHPPRESRSS